MAVEAEEAAAVAVAELFRNLTGPDLPVTGVSEFHQAAGPRKSIPLLVPRHHRLSGGHTTYLILVDLKKQIMGDFTENQWMEVCRAYTAFFSAARNVTCTPPPPPTPPTALFIFERNKSSRCHKFRQWCWEAPGVPSVTIVTLRSKCQDCYNYGSALRLVWYRWGAHH